jgi:hypothetical protein
MTSQIIGNLMAAFVIQHVEESTFYFILTCICLMAPFMFCFLGTPEPVLGRLDVNITQSILTVKEENEQS